MNDHKCAVCGHVNSPDAKLCDMCESQLGGPPDGRSYSYGEDADAPFISPARFKGVGDVFGPTLEVYRKNFLLIIILVVVATVPEVLLQYGLVQVLAASPGDAFVVVAPISVLLRIASLVGGAMLSGSLAYAVLDLRLAGSASARESLLRGLKSLPKVFLIYLMWSLVVGVGYLLCIVPGVILSLKYALVVPVAIAENRGPVESFDRSSKLTYGYKGLIFLTYFLWVIAIAVVGLIVGGSFAYGGGDENSFAVGLMLALVIGVLNSSTAVLTVFLYLGLLHERREGPGAHAAAPSGGASER